MKKYLFTTEDGVDIFEGDKYYTVNTVEHPIREETIKFFKERFNRDIPKTQSAGTIAGPYINPKATEPDGTIKYFFHKQNAVNFSKSLVV